MKQSKGEKAFAVVNFTFLTLISLFALYPFLYVLAASLSNPDDVITGKVLLFPRGFNLDSYHKVLSTRGLWVAYGNTIYYTVVGTAVSIIVTICGAYPLSKKRLIGRKFITFMVAFTMWFNAGMIPFYLNIKAMNLTNSRLGIIIAFACSAFYVILLRTYFQTIPDSMEESAKIDGANDIVILTRIILPLSLPAIATIGLYYAVDRWNGYFWSMILLKDIDKVPLQVLLKKLVVEMNVGEEVMKDSQTFNAETVIYTTIVVSVVPIVAIYPYIQKFFVQGIMVGSIKG